MNIESISLVLKAGKVMGISIGYRIEAIARAFSALSLADQLRPMIVANDLPQPGPRKCRFTGIAAMKREARRERNRRAVK